MLQRTLRAGFITPGGVALILKQVGKRHGIFPVQTSQTSARGSRSTRAHRGEGLTMPTYVMLLNFTEQGVRNIKASPKRAEVSKGNIDCSYCYWFRDPSSIINRS